jgi:purine-cytosine permease-like protein
VVVSIGLTFWWALIAIAAGTLIGALLIALHATQRPRLGVPQSIQSRGQFGFYGSAFLFPAVLLLNLGFIAAELVIQAQALNGVTAALSIPQWIVLLAVPSVVIGIFGYRWIHWAMQATAVVVGVSLVIMFIQGLRHGALPAHETGLAALLPALGPVAAIGAVSGKRDTLRECRRAGRRGCRRVRPGTLFVPLRALQAT